MKRIVIGLVLMLSLIAMSAVTIEEILQNEGEFIGKNVVVEGFLENWIESQEGTDYYSLKGDYGKVIMINSVDKPETGKKYIVSGLVQKDAYRNIPLIAARSVVLKDAGTQVVQQTKINPLLIVLGVLILLVIAISIVYFIISIKSKKSKSHSYSVPLSNPSVANSFADYSQKTQILPITTDSKTLILSREFTTMRSIPGRFIIVSEEESGKKFPIPAFQTPEGNQTTIGREDVKGAKAGAHIKISDKYRTVSRKQALITEKEGKVWIKNLSSTNPTEINGIVLEHGEEQELKYEDIMKMGELEFKYVER